MINPQNQKIVWITGASSGIGAALARHMARAGCIVAVSARSQDKLVALSQENLGSGRIIPYVLDVTDSSAQHHVIEKIYSELGPISVAVLNAGTYVPDEGIPKSDDIKKQFSLNVFSTMDALASLMPKMKQQKNAQIAVVASVVGYRGLPHALGYGGTKAALINMVEALKLDCDSFDIKLQLICPGFVKTPLTDRNNFPMPFLIEAEKAATIIAAGLESKKFEIVFPWQMALAMKFLRLLPYRLYFALVKKQTGVGKT